ncbi:MAG: hypothetical protein NUV93_07045 [Firmicutes bacterium]|nr:hypothetical protein [Bacillota bacterium]
MSKIVNQPVLVVTDGRKKPSRFFWWKRWFSVSRIIDIWSEVGKWWEGEPERTVYRVVSDMGAMFELQFEAPAGRWVLYKVYD